MAGFGSRFTKSGYKIFKPFLNLEDKDNMIDSICKNFPSNTRKYFIVNNLVQKKYLNKLKKIKNSKIIKISSHKSGPVETIIRANSELQNLKNVFVSYCDITWKWNFKKIKFTNNQIFCFKGWHPFTKNNNNYAFCKVNKNNSLIKIKEKSSFTPSWQKEPLSVGLFFFLNSKIMFDNFEKLKKYKIKTNNEYFPSESFNFIKNTKIEFVDQFVHVGIPRYLEEYKNWFYFFKNMKNFKKKIKLTKLADEYLIPAAGESKRFKKEGILIPKFLLNLKNNNKKIIEYIIDFLPSSKKKIILNKEIKNKNLLKNNLFKVIVLNKKTDGQATTIHHSLFSLKKDRSIFINSCDVFSIFNIKKFLEIKKKADLIVFVSSKSFQDLKDKEYTWVEIIKNKLKNIYIKNKPKKKLKILTGNFYFKNKDIFNKCFNESYKKKYKTEFYIDEIIKKASRLKFNVKVLEDEHYINFGTPDLVKDFIFWDKYFSK